MNKDPLYGEVLYSTYHTKKGIFLYGLQITSKLSMAVDYRVENDEGITITSLASPSRKKIQSLIDNGEITLSNGVRVVIDKNIDRSDLEVRILAVAESN